MQCEVTPHLSAEQNLLGKNYLLRKDKYWQKLLKEILRNGKYWQNQLRKVFW